jgi:tocopherol O-methyltransferase
MSSPFERVRTIDERHDPAGFYDRMDEAMRLLWGTHLHHGLWDDGDADHGMAARRMVWRIGEMLDLGPGSSVIDMGCGYGAAGVLLEHEFGHRVEGVTISKAQGNHAVAGSRVRVGDWLEGFGADASVDGLVAIESLEHMPDTPKAVAQMARVLRPGGRVVLACWVHASDPGWLERLVLLEPIQQAGHLTGQCSEAIIVRALREVGFKDLEVEELSARVVRTWTTCLWRSLRLVWTRPSVFRRLGWWESMSFGLSLPRIIAAYRLGLLRYVLISATR